MNYPREEVLALCKALDLDPTQVRHLDIEPWAIKAELYPRDEQGNLVPSDAYTHVFPRSECTPGIV